MSIIVLGLGVALGGFLGGAGRYILSVSLPPLVGTLVANTAACFLLALGLSGGSFVGVLLGAGLAGALSTWSTLAQELGQRLQQRAYVVVGTYLAATLVLGVVAADLGVLLS